MIQFHDFGIDIQTYTDRGKGNDFPDVRQCPHCPSRRPLHRHGYYQRYALTTEGEYHLWIARYRCQECRKTVSVLPSFLLPYVQYTRSVIWQAVKTWLETPRRGAKTKQVGFPTKEVILFYVRRFLRNLSRLHHAAARRWGIIGPVGNARTERAVWWMQTLEGRGVGSIIQDLWTNERWHPFADQIAS
ncbi:DUF6431 domain-containing protein [Anoxybacillus geothermalis]|uniref:DUF6431 domain-containing protein n=1 Tax=Geobacillus TaxID=129337 RepID=UPI0005AA0365|nr:MULTISPECIES: DUF6431 domain-containing protein [Geobacillus]MED5073456.1 DUF6431 domain-containing protein [Anoxybacillus geothermalis]QCK84018.1 transposase [Geobacillus kaustophilus NBRC 102445]QHN48472.1 transposase [Geobacillus stearothermophilus]QIZ65964.1 transposase [Geobacillus subterraneus]